MVHRAKELSSTHQAFVDECRHLNLIALSICQNWPARPVNLQRKCNNLEEHLGDNPSHSSGEVYIILEKCKFEGPVELVLPNARSGRLVLSNGKRP